MAVIIDFLRENLFWILFFIAGAVIFYVYTKLDQSTKNSLRKILSTKVIFFIFLIVLYIILHYNGGTITLKSANFYVPLIFLLFLVGYNFIGGLRYQTQHIVCANGFHGCYSKPPTRINGFLVFGIDSFNAGGLSWDFAGRILVLREETVEFCDEGAVSIARPTPCNTGLFEVEPEIKGFIENNRFLKGRNKTVLYGWFDDLEQIDWEFERLGELKKLGEDSQGIYEKLKKEFNVEKPKVSTLYWAYQNLKKAVNKQTEWYDATVETTEKGVEHRKRIKDAYIERGDRPNSMDTGHEEY